MKMASKWEYLKRISQRIRCAHMHPPSQSSTHSQICSSNNASKIALPSPWLGRFEEQSDFATALGSAPGVADVISGIDDQLMANRHPRLFPAYCTGCGSVQSVRFDWSLGGITPSGAIHPAWTETCVCQNCGLNSRMRAVLGFLLGHQDWNAEARCYLAERITPSYPAFARHFKHLSSSEYLGPTHKPGDMVMVAKAAGLVRHEDLTNLSFEDKSFDWVVTQDVFEHIPDYAAAFRECARVLSDTGHLVFSIPFNSALSRTQVRARMGVDGGIEHLLPPEIHGNPVDGKGALCFQNFGWDVLDTLRESGFTRAAAHTYWGPWFGHLGFGGIVFCADK